jgi:hypothetical protein
MSDVKAFIDAHLPAAQAVAQKIGVDPMIILGQWGLETGWGKSVVPGTNNLGNIKGAGVAAKDNATGSVDQYRAYQGPAQFSADFSNLIANRYPNAAGAGPDAHAYGNALKAGGYAEDPQYAGKIANAAATVRAASGVDIDPAKIKWDSAAPAPSGAPAVGTKAGDNGMVPGPSLSPQIDASKVKWDDTPPAAAAAPAPAQKPPSPQQAQRHETMPLDALGAAVEPLLTAGTSIIAAPVGGVVRLASAALGNTFEGAKLAGNKITDALTYHPQTQGGQDALSGLGDMATSAKNAVMNSPVGPAITAVGDAYNNTFVKGQNPLMATINSQVPTVIASAVPVGKAAGAAMEASGLNKLRGAISGGAAPAPGSIPFGPSGEPLTPRGQPLGTKPNYRPNGDGTFREAPPARSAVPPNGQAAPGASAQPGASAPPAPTFEAPEMPKPKTKLSATEQQANIDAMREIGLNSQRPSAISGDKFTAGQEYQHSKLDSPVGEVVREQLQQEQGAIKGYASGIVRDTGATAASPEAVGQSVRAPLQGLSEHYDTQVRGLYQAADERAGGIAGVVPDGFGQLMGTNSMFAGKAENSALRRGINAYMREQSIVDTKGNIQPITVQQAEGMRQYLNSQWSPQNSGLIGKIKESLDTDVAKAGGEDIYAQARALHAERKNTLDNPKGIASLLNESGPDGINKAVPDEKIGAKVITMPTAQFEHVVNTLKALPEGLAPQGAQALAEIKGELAKKIYAAGDSGGTQNGPSAWNAANVTRELNKQASKMALVFSPEEMAKFQTLNRGGHLLQTPSAYPGAAVQGHNLLQRGMIWAPPAMGGALGHAIAGYPGMALGTTAGGALSARMAKAADVANANKLRGIFQDPRPVK